MELATMVSQVRLAPKEFRAADVRAGSSATPEYYFHQGVEWQEQRKYNKAE
jgi:hypothetical protein